MNWALRFTLHAAYSFGLIYESSLLRRVRQINVFASLDVAPSKAVKRKVRVFFHCWAVPESEKTPFSFGGFSRFLLVASGLGVPNCANP